MAPLFPVRLGLLAINLMIALLLEPQHHLPNGEQQGVGSRASSCLERPESFPKSSPSIKRNQQAPGLAHFPNADHDEHDGARLGRRKY